MRSPTRGLWVGVVGLFMVAGCAWLVMPVHANQPEKSATEEHGKAKAAKAEAESAHAGDAAKKDDAHATDAAKKDEPHATGAASHATAEHGGAHGDAHGGHGDPHDLSHQNAGPQLEDPSQWKSDLALASFVVFLCLLLLLSKFAWRPVMEGLEKRERAIAENIEEARRSAEKAAIQLRQYEAKLAAATEEAREILNQARKDADAARERIVSEAQSAAQRERQRAVEDIAAAKNAALAEMTQKSVDLAVTMAGRLVRRQLNAEDHAKLIREGLEQLPTHH